MTAMSPVDQAGPPRASRATHRHTTVALLRATAFAMFMALSSLAASHVAAQESTPADASPTPAITPAPDARRLELTLRELNDSGVSGTVTLFDAGDRTIVEIDAEGTGENHPSHIHAGRCDDLTPDVGYPLENVQSGETTTSVVDVPLDDLLANPFSVDLHLAPNELGTLIACAEIEGEPTGPEGVATPTTAPAEATPTATEAAAETPIPTETEAPVPTGTTTAATATAAPTEAPAATEAATPATAGATEDSDGTGGAINDNQNAASLPLFTQGESGVTGTAVLTADGEQTLISILLSGDAVTGGHIVHLHDGTCAAPGDYTLDLNPIDEGGVSETTVDIPFQDLLSDGYFINVHESDANWDNWFVCGELSNATVGVVVPEVAPPTGGGPSPTPTPAPTAVAVTTPPVTEGDGTAGLSGKGTPIGETTSLPQSAGVGASLPWPNDPVSAVIWASVIGAFILGAGAWLVRRGERHPSHNPTRWTRLGI
jgi:hypothetical protein